MVAHWVVLPGVQILTVTYAWLMAPVAAAGPESTLTLIVFTTGVVIAPLPEVLLLPRQPASNAAVRIDPA
ncbi:MAG: hypothetical protein NVS1B6_15400 [Steroidobacteraceae bacterium]